MRRVTLLLQAVAAAALLVVASAASAQDYAIVFVDPADGIQKVRVPTNQARAGLGLQWSLTERGRAVAYNSTQEYTSPEPQRYRIFAFFQYQERPTQRYPANPLDPYGFVFEEVDANEEGTEKAVVRVALRWSDYEAWNEQAIQKILTDIASGQAGVQLPQNADPQAFAQWMHYYNQLGLWERYIEDEILLEPIEATRPNDPQRIRDEIPLYIESILTQRDELAEEEYQENLAFYRQMRSRSERRERYEEWRAEQQVALLEFAEIWARRVEGTEVIVEGQPFIVSAEPLASPPKGRVPVVSPSQRLTPYDLLDEQGNVREPYVAE